MSGKVPRLKDGQDTNMALSLILRNQDFYTYRDCTAAIVGGPYGAYCTGLSQYRESIALLDSFVYDAAADRYRYVCWHNQVDYPSWDIWTGTIHPETGVRETHVSTGGYAAVGHAWTSTSWNGGLNKRYALYLGAGVVEITEAISLPTVYQIANPVLTVTQIPNMIYTQHGVIISPERRYAMFLDAVEGVVTYDYSNHPAVAVKKWTQPFHEGNPWSLGYENDEIAWILYSDVFFGSSAGSHQSLVKYNYFRNQFELVSEIQQGVGTDLMARIAFDTKRKKLAVFRVKADAANGAAVNAFELYSPHPAMSRVTVPVNITRLAPDTRTQFRTHLLGTKAEGGANKSLDLTQVSSLGTLPRTQVYTEDSGAAQFEYQSTTDLMADTVTAQYDETKVII